MKKFVISSIVIVLACISITVIMNIKSSFSNQKIDENRGEPPKIPQILESQTEDITNPNGTGDSDDSHLSLTYIVKAYNGKVCVFEKGKEIPFKTTDCLVKNLPACDRETLEKGIEVKGENDLNRILEDYCG